MLLHARWSPRASGAESGGLIRSFLSKTASPTADDWRVFAEAFDPLCFLQYWALFGAGSRKAFDKQRPDPNPRMTQNCLDMLMNLMLIVHLLFRPSITEVQLTTAEDRIEKFTKMAISQYRGLQEVWNMHSLSHIPQDIRNFGPVYGYWCFSSERFNKTLKNINTNSHIEQVPRTLMRTFQQYSHLDDLAACGTCDGSVQDAHVSRMATSMLDSIYRKCSQETTHTTEQQWAAQWEQDR
jgi:hypothetical protein